MNNRVLTNEQAKSIRELRIGTCLTFKELADRFSVSQGTIRNVCSGRLYRDAGGPSASECSIRGHKFYSPPGGFDASLHDGSKD